MGDSRAELEQVDTSVRRRPERPADANRADQARRFPIGAGAAHSARDASTQRALAGLQRAAGNRAAAAAVGSWQDAEAAAGEAVRSTVAGSGRPLGGDVRAAMESTLGADLSDVRVHDDAGAAASAAAVQAKAYTSGSHLVFGEDQYQPASSAGQRLLAHELTHVVQQRSGPVDGTETSGGIRLSDPSDRFEQAAERAADRFASGGGTGSVQGSFESAGTGEDRASSVQTLADDDEEEAGPPAQREVLEEEEPGVPVAQRAEVEADEEEEEEGAPKPA